MEILLVVALFAPVVYLMERTHRRTCDLPRAPFGFDAESEASSHYRRQLAELRALSGQLDAASVPTPAQRTPAVSAALTRLQRTLGASFTPLGGWSGTATTLKHC